MWVRSLTGWEPEKGNQGESSRGAGRTGIRGGFRALRSDVPRGALIVLTGLSGSGKSAVLADLAAAGEQVLDLQALARHRGSAFGGFGLPPQPSHQQFQSSVREVLATRDPGRPLWLERCPPYLGSVGLPDELQAAMAAAPAVIVHRPRRDRITRIVAEYGGEPIESWYAALARVTPRLGAGRTARVRAALDAGDLRRAAGTLLTYYDEGYRLAARPARTGAGQRR
jgi:tRNA 2-selenouridine synthase